MGIEFINFVESRPQRLCKMCGKCCRVATASESYDKLMNLMAEGDESAKDFLDIFVPYNSIEEARAVDADIVDNILAMFDGPLSDIQFYYCKYIKDDNLCGIYKNRKDLCDRFPSSPWAVVPPDCGFEGWLFQKREEYKQKVRKQKENLLYLQTLLANAQSQEQRDKIQKSIDNIESTINMFQIYGAKDW